jgi:hypothetical protein
MEYCVGGAEKPYHGIRSVRSRKAPSVEYYVGGAEKLPPNTPNSHMTVIFTSVPDVVRV